MCNAYSNVHLRAGFFMIIMIDLPMLAYSFPGHTSLRSANQLSNKASDTKLYQHLQAPSFVRAKCHLQLRSVRCRMTPGRWLLSIARGRGIGRGIVTGFELNQFLLGRLLCSISLKFINIRTYIRTLDRLYNP